MLMSPRRAYIRVARGWHRTPDRLIRVINHNALSHATVRRRRYGAGRDGGGGGAEAEVEAEASEARGGGVDGGGDRGGGRRGGREAEAEEVEASKVEAWTEAETEADVSRWRRRCGRRRTRVGGQI